MFNLKFLTKETAANAEKKVANKIFACLLWALNLLPVAFDFALRLRCKGSLRIETAGQRLNKAQLPKTVSDNQHHKFY